MFNLNNTALTGKGFCHYLMFVMLSFISAQALALPFFNEAEITIVMDEDAAPIPFDLLLQANPPEDGDLTWQFLGEAQNGFVRFDLAGTTVVPTGLEQNIIYEPNANFHGMDTFTIQVQDDNLIEFDFITINIEVNPINDAATGQFWVSSEMFEDITPESILTARIDNVADVDGINDIEIIWYQKLQADLEVGRGELYEVQISDMDTQLFFVMHYTDDLGNIETLSSETAKTVVAKIDGDYDND